MGVRLYCTKELMAVELMAIRWWWGVCDADVDEDECIVFKMLMF